MWSHETCGLPGGGPCGSDRRYCLTRGWRCDRRRDGTVEIRFTCSALDLRITGPRTGAVAWTLARPDRHGGFVVHERGYTRRLLTAARDLAEALDRLGLEGWLEPQEIAVAIVVAESRTRHALAQWPAPTWEPV